jgi:hypothetical protein
MAKHTFLLKEGYWKASGKYRDDRDNEYPVSGQSIVKHLASKWINKGVMCVYADRSINFTNEYEIEPLQSGKKTLDWISHNAAMGHIYGSFTVKDKEIVSEYQSEKNKYKGTERFVYKSDNKYVVEGKLLKGGEIVSTWTVTLERQSAAMSAKHH